MFNEWCPGLNEELAGFAGELAVPIKSVVYYAMTYLRPSCSLSGPAALQNHRRPPAHCPQL